MGDIGEEWPADAEDGGAGPKLSTSEALAAAALAMLSKQQRKKKRIPGIDRAGDDESEDEEENRSGMAGARGTEAALRLESSMTSHPAEHSAQMEQCMAVAVDEESLSMRGPLQWEKSVPPVEGQKIVGYFIHSLCHILMLQRSGKHDAGKLLTLRVLAACEQACLDGSWDTAWELTGLSQPPWSSWKQQDGGALRKQRFHSSLVSARWASTMVQSLKDKETFEKRRVAKGKGKAKDD